MPTTSNIVSRVASIDAIVLEIQDFLEVCTPEAWVSHALGDLATLLIDHANCEYKAAATGMSLITKYRNKPSLQRLMARLVREEMLHYEQVLVLMDQMGVDYRPLTASRYAKTLRDAVRSDEDGRLVICNLHTLDTARRYCDRVIGMRAGQIVFDGRAEELTGIAGGSARGAAFEGAFGGAAHLARCRRSTSTQRRKPSSMCKPSSSLRSGRLWPRSWMQQHKVI